MRDWTMGMTPAHNGPVIRVNFVGIERMVLILLVLLILLIILILLIHLLILAILRLGSDAETSKFSYPICHSVAMVKTNMRKGEKEKSQ